MNDPVYGVTESLLTFTSNRCNRNTAWQSSNCQPLLA